MIPDLKAAFDKHDGESFKFERIEYKRSRYREVHALLLIEEITKDVPIEKGITWAFSNACHDEVWLEIEPEQLAKYALDHHILELVRCGLQYDDSMPGFLFRP